MGKILKIILWVLAAIIVIYLAFGRTNKEVVAPTPEMTGGPAGDRAFLQTDLETNAGASSDSSIQ